MKPRSFPLLALLTSTAACAALLVSMAAAGPTPYEEQVRQRICGTPEPTTLERQQLNARVQRWLEESGPLAAGGGGTVRVAFHVLYNGDEGLVSDDQIDDQIKEMNKNFAGTGYRFVLTSVDRTENPSWFRMGPFTGAEKQCKQALAIDPAHHLNLYTAKLPRGLLGWAYFPFYFPEDYFLHGVVVHYGSLPGGFIDRFNLGRTATHEAGHYLGLWHTFQGGCTPPGDEVDDTPYEASPAFGCPIGRNSCPDPGDDPIHNYMDYTDDECYTEFTSGQVARTNYLLPIYRPSLFEPIALAAGAKEGAGAFDPPDVTIKGAARLDFRGAFPNPFSDETLLHFYLPSAQHVSLKVYNVAGQRVATLVEGEMAAGEQSVRFRPSGLPPGMYFAALRLGSGATVNRTVILVQ